MRKRIFTCVLVCMSVFLMVPIAKAIITVPDDYLWYDTGILADSTNIFEFPDWMDKTENVVWGNTGKNMTRKVDAFFEMWGTSDMTQKMWGITIPLTKDPIRKDSVPSDSLVLNLPFCDSIYIQGGLVGKGLLAYMTGNDTVWYSGASSGYPDIVAFRPRQLNNSLQVVIHATLADWYSDEVGGGSDYGTVYNNFDHKEGERYGLYGKNAINRIKIFGKIEPAVIPPFEGTIAGWDFLYKPNLSTGTPNADEMAPSDGTWEGEFKKYASETGVVRGVLSVPSAVEYMQLGKECGETQNIKFSSAGINDTADFLNPATYSKYYQIDLSTKGYNNIQMDFSFNIRDAADSCVVVYSTDKKTYQLAGKFATTDQFDGLSQVSLPFSEINNQQDVIIRLLLNNGEYGENGEFVLGNISFTGDVAEKFAYVSSSGKADKISNALKDYQVSIVKPSYSIDSLVWAQDSIIADSVTVNEIYKNYDVVVYSDACSDSEKMNNSLKYLIGNKAVLNLKSNAYGENAWNWASPSDGVISEQTETKVRINSGYANHPLFTGIEPVEECVGLFDSLLPITTITTDTVWFVEGGKDTFSLDIDTVYSYIGVQGFVTSGYTGQKSSFVATQVGTPEATAIHEINAVPEAKYLFVGLKSKNYNAISQTGYQLLLNAVEYLLSQEAFNNPDGIKSNRIPAGNANIYTRDGLLYINAEESSLVEIYDLLGQKIKTRKLNEGLNMVEGLLPNTLYLVKMNSKIVKVRTK